ncbi:hypothetical protein [Spirosoma sp. KNUC1025]|uniref:hypothetical protein n=1 Tax=Spirosoma sp. KNUC1025 TaxID=2894082 RepID=UPI00386692D5|nr:hypothetical protein LN737_28905 [Spirosoma sp. KNUC1025]
MLQQLYDSLKDQLLSIEGIAARPYAAATGNTPKGGIEEFLLNGKHFAGLRLTDKFLMFYLSPLYCFPELDAQYADQLKPVRAGKSCLKIAKPEKLDRSAIDAILRKGSANWPTN